LSYHSIKEVLIRIINKSDWWHVPPEDPLAYLKRGKFLASTYLQAEFYGRPNIKPEKVQIYNPVFDFTEREIMCQLFNKYWYKNNELVVRDGSSYNKRIEVDHRMCIRAKLLGYDSIVLMTESGLGALQKGRKPNSMELNLLEF